MKISKSLAFGFTSLFAAFSLFSSCQKPAEEVEDTLSVTPSSAIQFKATGNEDVVLNVKTNVSEWKYSAPEWVVAEQSGSTLKVNAADNPDTEVQRFGKIVFSAGNAETVSVTVIQDVAEEGMAILSVSPITPIEFKANGNEPVELKVETNQPSWECETPEWIKAVKSETAVTLTADDNIDAERSGFVKITAGEAKAVNIKVSQEAYAEEIPGVVTATLLDADKNASQANLLAKINTEGTVANLKVTLVKAVDTEVTATVALAPESYLTEFNAITGKKCEMLPDDCYKLPELMKITVPSGKTESETNLEINITSTNNFGSINYATEYLLPLVVTENSDKIGFTPKSKRVNYVIKKMNDKPIKNLVCFEINDCNPLNALETKFEDGSLFFDAVVLFSGNIAWDNGTQSVRFNARTGEPVCNTNIAQVVNEWETYIQPLRDAGLKVYMGIMPHHTQAGITTLSYEGCKKFGEEIGNLVKRCHFDGVFLDEEYVDHSGGSYGQMSDYWKNPRANGSYFAYQMKKQMDLAVKGEWETGVIVYQYGLNCGQIVTDHEDQTRHTPDEFIMLNVPDYGGKGTPYSGMTKKNCAGFSYECGLMRGYVNNGIMDEGYGWAMWFGYNPDDRSSTNTIKTKGSIDRFNDASRAFYKGMKVKYPTHYYTKNSRGFDPTRYEMGK